MRAALRLVSLFTLALGVLHLTTPALEADEIVRLAPKDASVELAEGDAVLVDVREPGEWADSGVVASAYLLPLSDLCGERARWSAFLQEHRDKRLILYCRSGNRSGQAAQILAREGFRVANAGGFRDWTTAGVPTRSMDEPRSEAAAAPAAQQKSTAP